MTIMQSTINARILAGTIADSFNAADLAVGIAAGQCTATEAAALVTAGHATTGDYAAVLDAFDIADAGGRDAAVSIAHLTRAPALAGLTVANHRSTDTSSADGELFGRLCIQVARSERAIDPADLDAAKAWALTLVPAEG